MARVGARGQEILLQQHAIDPYVDTILKLADTARSFRASCCMLQSDRQDWRGAVQISAFSHTRVGRRS